MILVMLYDVGYRNAECNYDKCRCADCIGASEIQSHEKVLLCSKQSKIILGKFAKNL
jgi:hypothetical protein